VWLWTWVVLIITCNRLCAFGWRQWDVIHLRR